MSKSNKSLKENREKGGKGTKLNEKDNLFLYFKKVFFDDYVVPEILSSHNVDLRKNSKVDDYLGKVFAFLHDSVGPNGSSIAIDLKQSPVVFSFVNEYGEKKEGMVYSGKSGKLLRSCGVKEAFPGCKSLILAWIEKHRIVLKQFLVEKEKMVSDTKAEILKAENAAKKESELEKRNGVLLDDEELKKFQQAHQLRMESQGVFSSSESELSNNSNNATSNTGNSNNNLTQSRSVENKKLVDRFFPQFPDAKGTDDNDVILDGIQGKGAAQTPLSPQIVATNMNDLSIGIQRKRDSETDFLDSERESKKMKNTDFRESNSRENSTLSNSFNHVNVVPGPVDFSFLSGGGSLTSFPNLEQIRSIFLKQQPQENESSFNKDLNRLKNEIRTTRDELIKMGKHNMCMDFQKIHNFHALHEGVQAMNVKVTEEMVELEKKLAMELVDLEKQRDELTHGLSKSNDELKGLILSLQEEGLKRFNEFKVKLDMEIAEKLKIFQKQNEDDINTAQMNSRKTFDGLNEKLREVNVKIKLSFLLKCMAEHDLLLQKSKQDLSLFY